MCQIIKRKSTLHVVRLETVVHSEVKMVCVQINKQSQELKYLVV